MLNKFLLLGFSLALAAACTSYRSEEVRGSTETQTVPSPSVAGDVQARMPDGEVTASTQDEGVIQSGNFIAGEYATSGVARILGDSGQLLLELDQSFQTSPMGPDLVVVLHRSNDVIGSAQPPAFPLQEGDYVVLAALQSFSGQQRYPIPDTVNLDDYRSVAIWCRRFNATFGAATLQ
ncbi:DM13 domain-containing protein [Thermosynechococcaceae cyanobacterium Okahandja]